MEDISVCALKQLLLTHLKQITRCSNLAEIERLAREHQAFVRARGLPNACLLLQLILLYALLPLSFRELSWFALVAFRKSLSDEALNQRFRKAFSWLRALTLLQLRRSFRLSTPLSCTLRIIDATGLCREGATGTDMRCCVLFEPNQLLLSSVEITDKYGAEGLDHGQIPSRCLVIGDCNYGRHREFKTASERKIDLLARTHFQMQPMQWLNGQALNPRTIMRKVNKHRWVDCKVWLTKEDQAPMQARLIVVKATRAGKQRELHRILRNASRLGKTADPLNVKLAGYFCLVTTLPSEVLSVKQACGLYGMRWQVEYFFKRCKSLGRLDELRGHDELVQTQIWSRLLLISAVEQQRTKEAMACHFPERSTVRPRTLWRWYKCQVLFWLAPYLMLLTLRQQQIPIELQDNCLRERPRKRKVFNLVDYLRLEKDQQ